MGALAITAILELGKMAIKRIWEDPEKQAEEERKLIELSQKGELAELDAYVRITLAQIEVNKVSAKNPSLFVSGARPFIIWVGGFSMAWSGLFHPLLVWVWAFTQMDGNPPPMIESAVLGSVVTGLLGVAGMRSFDGMKGNKKDSL